MRRARPFRVELAGNQGSAFGSTDFQFLGRCAKALSDPRIAAAKVPYALSLLPVRRHAGEGFASRGGRRGDPAAARVPDCGGRFTTFERVQLRDLVVLKKSGRKVPFNRDKLLRSLEIAVRKRNVDPERIDRAVTGIVRQLESWVRRKSRPKRSAGW